MSKKQTTVKSKAQTLQSFMLNDEACSRKGHVFLHLQQPQRLLCAAQSPGHSCLKAPQVSFPGCSFQTQPQSGPTSGVQRVLAFKACPSLFGCEKIPGRKATEGRKGLILVDNSGYSLSLWGRQGRSSSIGKSGEE